MKPAVLAIGIIAVSANLWAADKFAGTWKENPAKAQYAPATDIIVIEPVGNGIRVTGPEGPMYTGNFDQNEYPGTGVYSNDRFKLKKIDDKDWQVTDYRNGQKVLTERYHVSDDGNKLTRTVTTHHAKGGDTINVYTYNRKGERPGGPYPYLGSWSMDHGATRYGAINTMTVTRNGDHLRWVDPVSGEVMTVNPDSGKASLSGPIASDSAATTKRVDENTLEVDYNRGGKKVEDVYTLSADGRIMTAKEIRTDPNGNQIMDTRIYERQP